MWVSRWPTENSHGSLLLEGRDTGYKTGILDSSVWSRSSSTVVTADILQPTTEAAPRRRPVNRQQLRWLRNIAPRRRPTDRQQVNRLRQRAVRQITARTVLDVRHQIRTCIYFKEQINVIKTSDIVFFLSLYVFRLWTNVRYHNSLISIDFIRPPQEPHLRTINLLSFEWIHHHFQW